jgi:RimJ/RimL family protein N-acetyltransferase
MGYATEAARGVRDACLRGDTGDHIVAVFCHIAPTHVKSQAVAKALDLHPTERWHEGEIRWEQDEDASISTSRYLA